MTANINNWKSFITLYQRGVDHKKKSAPSNYSYAKW